MFEVQRSFLGILKIFDGEGAQRGGRGETGFAEMSPRPVCMAGWGCLPGRSYVPGFGTNGHSRPADGGGA